MKDSRTLFGVLPYLTLFEPVTILGVDLDMAEADASRPLFDEILSFFRDAHGDPISAATCFSLSVGSDARREAAQRMQDLVALLGYLLLDPEHPASSPTAENLALWIFEPVDACPGIYKATPNLVRSMTVAVGDRVFYPPTPDVAVCQDHINADSPALILLDSPALLEPEQAVERSRLLLAMYWYGRSFSTNPQEDDRSRIVHLATAFEVLLRVGIAPGKRLSIQAELQNLLGEHKLLDDWTEQFYDTRSEIVHRGWTDDLLFRHPHATRAHEPLVRSGQRILRLAVEAELRQRAGGALARELPGLFYQRYVAPDLEPNEARLARLRSWGSLRGRGAREFLNLIGELRLTDASGHIVDVAKVGRLLLRYFTSTCLTGTRPHPEIQAAAHAGVDHSRMVEAYAGVQNALREGSVTPWPVTGRSGQRVWRTERALRHFAAYVEAVVPRMAARGAAPDSLPR